MIKMIQDLLFTLTLFFGSGKEGVSGWWVVEGLSEISLLGELNFCPSNRFDLHVEGKREGSGLRCPCLSPSSGTY